MLAHTSVYSTSAPEHASAGSLSSSTAPPVCVAISRARCTTCGMGSKPGGVATRIRMPTFAQPSRSEWVTLLPSPRYASVRLFRSPLISRTVKRSARHWQGCSKSESALTTGTEDAAASNSSRSCSNVRRTTTSTYRESTRPVSSIVSPRPSWSSAVDSATGCAPAEAAATSNETRVRVDGFSKTMATALPWSRPA